MNLTGRGHLMRDARAEAAAGLAALALGAILLHDAYENRARKQPWWMRPLSFW